MDIKHFLKFHLKDDLRMEFDHSLIKQNDARGKLTSFALPVHYYRTKTVHEQY